MTVSYPYIPEGRKFIYVPITDRFMAEAKRIRDELSTEKNYPTGAVIVIGDQIVGKEVNRPPLKNKTLQEYHKNGWCVRQWFKIPSGQKYWACPGCASSKYHAESRAIKDALRNRPSIEGASLYLYGHWWCCKPCWDNIISAGIKDVYLPEDAKSLFEKRAYMLKDEIKASPDHSSHSI